MSEHVEARTDRASRRRGKADRRIARAALHKAGNPEIAAARRRCQAGDAESSGLWNFRCGSSTPAS